MDKRKTGHGLKNEWDLTGKLFRVTLTVRLSVTVLFELSVIEYVMI